VVIIIIKMKVQVHGTPLVGSSGHLGFLVTASQPEEVPGEWNGDGWR